MAWFYCVLLVLTSSRPLVTCAQYFTLNNEALVLKLNWSLMCHDLGVVFQSWASL